MLFRYRATIVAVQVVVDSLAVIDGGIGQCATLWVHCRALASKSTWPISWWAATYRRAGGLLHQSFSAKAAFRR
ncbi:hypothetical protein C5L38_33610 [Streptomyces sp. WAC00288]|nr:hypothetical protein C5L38_33610 [Streptomyces sp. WAC00288]